MVCSINPRRGISRTLIHRFDNESRVLANRIGKCEQDLENIAQKTQDYWKKAEEACDNGSDFLYRAYMSSILYFKVQANQILEEWVSLSEEFTQRMEARKKLSLD